MSLVFHLLPHSRLLLATSLTCRAVLALCYSSLRGGAGFYGFCLPLTGQDELAEGEERGGQSGGETVGSVRTGSLALGERGSEKEMKHQIYMRFSSPPLARIVNSDQRW